MSNGAETTLTVSRSRNDRSAKRDEGLALIIVLAIIAILSILVLEFNASVFVDLDISSNLRDRTQAEYNARAGLQYAIKLLRDDTTRDDNLQEPWAEPHEVFLGDLVKHYDDPEDDEEENPYLTEEEKPEPVDHGLGKVYVLVTDEERKLNIKNIMTNITTPNTEFKEIVLRLIRNLDYADVDADELVENMVDWMDQDDDGAAEESTYYEYLEQPYEPRNAPIQSIYELLLIKGMSRQVFFGNTPFPLQESGKEEEEEESYDYNYYEQDYSYHEEEYDEPDLDAVYGLRNFLTVYSRGPINVNTAPREILLAVFDDNYYLVDDIIEARLDEPFSSFDRARALLQTVSPTYYNVKRKHITFTSIYFLVESIGEYRNSRVRLLTCVERNSRRDVKILYQRIENMSMDEEASFIGEEAKRKRR